MTATATATASDKAAYDVWAADTTVSKSAIGAQLGITAAAARCRINRWAAYLATQPAAETEAAISPYAADPANPTDAELAAAIERGLADGTMIDAADWMAQHAAAVAAGDAIAEAAPAITEAVRNVETSDQPAAAGEPASPVKGEQVTECDDCGFQFSRPQARRTCQSAAACQKRQAARQATA